MAININDLDKSPSGKRAPDNPPYRPPQRLGGFLAPASPIANGDTAGVVVNVLGSGRIRLVVLVTGAGATLALKWRLADHVTNQALNQPGTVALVAGTENILDITNNPGYAYAEITILSAGAVVVSYVDVFQTKDAN